MKYLFDWDRETLRLWGVTADDWETIESSLLGCMNHADTQCADVTFKLEEHGNDKTRIIVLVRGLPSGIIRPR